LGWGEAVTIAPVPHCWSGGDGVYRYACGCEQTGASSCYTVDHTQPLGTGSRAVPPGSLTHAGGGGDDK